MPNTNRFAELHEKITEWRQDLHAHPELLFDVHRTASVVEEKLRSFGVDELVTGVAQTGVVAVIHGKSNRSGKVIGLRADMDALPIQELPERAHKSTVDGKMHACGHDGHTAMLLGAAQYLAETRQFDGSVVVIFQPAEEGGGGGKVMVDEGMLDRFNVQEVYGMHNMPGIPSGKFSLTEGPILAAADFFEVKVEGVGGHAARPHSCVDPAIVVAQLVQSFQTIVSRNTGPLQSLVISTTQIHMGDADNVIPQTAVLSGTVRTLAPDVRDMVEQRMKTVCEHVALSNGATATFDYKRGYPVTVNHPEQTRFAASIAKQVVGEQQVESNMLPIMGAEDFSYMLEARPGAFVFIGQGDSAGLHHPEYDFNDEIIPTGCSYWVQLVESAMPLGV